MNGAKWGNVGQRGAKCIVVDAANENCQTLRDAGQASKRDAHVPPELPALKTGCPTERRSPPETSGRLGRSRDTVSKSIALCV